MPNSASYVVGFGLLVAYVGLVWYASRFPPLGRRQNRRGCFSRGTAAGPTFKAGMYFLLPVVVLIWYLAVEQFSPGLSVFYGLCFMLFIC